MFATVALYETTPGGVGKSWGKSMDAFHWSSLVCSGQSIDLCNLMVLCWGMCRSTLEGAGNTYDTIYRILLWSLLALYRGRWPTHDWQGQPLHAPQGRKYYEKSKKIKIKYDSVKG
jgi:hypothetical protein